MKRYEALAKISTAIAETLGAISRMESTHVGMRQVVDTLQVLTDALDRLVKEGN